MVGFYNVLIDPSDFRSIECIIRHLLELTVLSVAFKMFSLDTKMRIYQVERLGCVMLKGVNLDYPVCLG